MMESNGEIFKSVINHLPIGYAYLSSDAGEPDDYVFRQVNPAFANITGFTSHNIIGKKVSEIFSELKKEFDDAAARGSVAINGECKEFARYIRHSNRWLKALVYSPAAGYYGMLLCDATEEKQLLEDKENLIASLNDIVVELDKDYTYRNIWTNDESMLIKPKKDLLHKRLDEVFDAETMKVFLDGLHQAATGKKVVIEREFLKRGEIKWSQVKVFSKDNHLNGRKYYMVISDITERKQAELNLQKRLDYEQLLNRISLMAVNNENIEMFLNESLRMMGEILNISRTYIFEYDQQTETMNNTYEWVAPRIGPEIENLQGIPVSSANWHDQMMRSNQPTVYKDIEDIPDEGTKNILRPQGIKSILIVPLFLEKTYFGFLGFDECNDYRDWPEEDVNLLQSISRLITQVILQQRVKEELQTERYHDSLTGLYNRRFFDVELRRLDTARQLPISIIMGDVNGLKLINDVYGHQEGDRLLQSIAQILKSFCRAEDVIARWGGDEYIILLPQTSPEAAAEVCKRINEVCKKQDQARKYLSISLGCATKKEAVEDIMQTLKKAEDSMYKSKLLEHRSLRCSIIASLKNTLLEKNPGLEDHSERMKYFCQKISGSIGLSENNINALDLLCMLRDIGNIAITDSILAKRDKLTEEEWSEIKKHSEIGYRIAQADPELSQIAEYILSHHERWDGKGYPQGLKGENIPLLSRIMAVVAAYDAMISDRPYRRDLSISEAKKELLANSGTQFDPEIVRIFLEVVLEH